MAFFLAVIKKLAGKLASSSISDLGNFFIFTSYDTALVYPKTLLKSRFLVMELFMDVAEVAVGDVGVDLSGPYVGMAEESLDGTQVGAV